MPLEGQRIGAEASAWEDAVEDAVASAFASAPAQRTGIRSSSSIFARVSPRSSAL